MWRAVNTVFAIVCGIIGGWVGYWIGHFAGWSTNADWPAHIGGGTGAILLSILLALIGVAVAAAIMSVGPYRRTRRLLRIGTPAQAKVLEVKRAGLTIRGLREIWEKVCCELEVHPSEGSPFQARACQFASRSLEAALRPGAMVEVRYDRAKPARAAVEGPAVP
jgi:hypothetical protein